MNYLFYTLLALFAFLPLPRGATFDWAWLLMSVVVYAMVAVWLIWYRQGKVSVTPAFKVGALCADFMFIWLAWNFLQIVPLPIGLLERYFTVIS